MTGVEAIDDRKLARWRATRDGALYACPHCWAGTREAGRCKHCRRFDVRALSPHLTPVLWVRPPLPELATAAEEALREARRPKRRKRRRAAPLP